MNRKLEPQMAASRTNWARHGIWGRNALSGFGVRSLSVEHDHAADPVLALHQLEGVVDLLEPDPVRDERVDVELAVQVELHELGHLISALDPAERAAAHAPAGDQIARDDVERLALAGHAGDRAKAPTHARRLDGLTHHAGQPGCLERVIGAEAAGLVEHLLHRVGAAGPGLGGSLAPCQAASILARVDARDPI